MRTANLSSRPRAINNHSIVGSAAVTANVRGWDRALAIIERELSAGLAGVTNFPEVTPWESLEWLSADHCAFHPGLVEYDDGTVKLTYRYVVLKGSVPFNISFEEASNANDREGNYCRVAPASS